MLAVIDTLANIRAFMAQGGDVLWLIAALTLVMWTLIFERIWYYHAGWMKRDIDTALQRWQGRDERSSWNAHQIRYAMISRVEEKVNRNRDMIKTLVALAPLLGLLGTVTGMIEVFNVLAVSGGGDARSMAGGVSKATIPTMAGMVAALSGIFGNTYVSRKADKENHLFADHLTLEHD